MRPARPRGAKFRGSLREGGGAAEARWRYPEYPKARLSSLEPYAFARIGKMSVSEVTGADLCEVLGSISQVSRKIGQPIRPDRVETWRRTHPLIRSGRRYPERLPDISSPGVTKEGFAKWRSKRLAGGGSTPPVAEGRCRSAHAHQTSGVDGHEIAHPMGTPTLPQVIDRLAVAPRAPDRRCRPGALRTWEARLQLPGTSSLKLVFWIPGM